MAVEERTKKGVSVRVYKYGLVPKGCLPDEAKDELLRANNLWNKLVEISRKNQSDFDEVRKKAHPPYGEEMVRLETINKKIDDAYDRKRDARKEAGTRDETHPLIIKANAVIEILKEERSEIYDTLKLLRTEADKSVDKKALNESFKSNIKLARRETSLNSDTKEEIIRNDFRTARDRTFKTGGRLRFHTFDGTGYWHFRFRRNDEKGKKVDDYTIDDLFAGEKPSPKKPLPNRFKFLSRDDTRRKPRLRLRTTLAGGRTNASKVFQEFDVIYHRPVPEGAIIPNAKILRTRTGDKFRYDLVLTVYLPEPKHKDIPLDDAIGIDLGFREDPDDKYRKQVGAIISLDPSDEVEEIFAPPKMVKAFGHIDELKSVLDESAADLGMKIKPLMKDIRLPEDNEKYKQEYKLWNSIVNARANVTLSFEKAYKLALWCKKKDAGIPEDITGPVVYWWKGYSRRYRELHNLRKKQLLNRKDFYRQIASRLVLRGLLIGVENFNLSKIARSKDEDNVLNNKARANRFLLSPSEFRAAIKNAADREGIPCLEVNPANTSKICFDCGTLNKNLGSEKNWVCPACGCVHDRDTNAARNIAKRALEKYLEDRKSAGK